MLISTPHTYATFWRISNLLSLRLRSLRKYDPMTTLCLMNENILKKKTTNSLLTHLSDSAAAVTKSRILQYHSSEHMEVFIGEIARSNT